MSLKNEKVGCKVLRQEHETTRIFSQDTRWSARELSLPDGRAQVNCTPVVHLYNFLYDRMNTVCRSVGKIAKSDY